MPFVALKSRLWTPSPYTTNDWPYRVHAPPSKRYQIESGGEVSFTSCNVTVTADVYQPEEPAVPFKTARETGAMPLIVPFTTAKEFVGSMFPATSMEW